MTKDEEQLARDKDAITKMVGAKSAMEAAIRRIEQLTTALKHVQYLHDDAIKAISDHAHVSSYFSGELGRYSQDSKMIPVRQISAAIAAIVHKQTSGS